MTLHRFFVEFPLDGTAGGVLSPAQSRQIRSVLRLREGDEVILFDGSGIEATATLTAVNAGGVDVEIASTCRPDRETALIVTVGLALIRGERFELALQKLTEVGVRAIVPLATDHAVVNYRRPGEWLKKADRFRRIIVEAMEQSERVTDVVLEEPVSLDDFLSRFNVIALTERADARPLSRFRFDDQVTLAIGPEGGWSARERELIACNATQASLGGLILRAETAAIVAAATVIQNHPGNESA